MKTPMKPLALVLVVLAGCAKADRAPLPGDSVAADGAVALTPQRVPSLPVGTTRTNAADLSSIESRLYPPELVMQNQAAIGLAPGQRDAIAKETERAHKELLELQWQLDAEKEKLVTILDGDKVDEARSKAAAAEVMKKEEAIKAGHLAMLVRIKNTLTKEQQDKLRAIRDAQRCAGTSPTPNVAPSGAIHTPPSDGGSAPVDPLAPRPPAKPKPAPRPAPNPTPQTPGY